MSAHDRVIRRVLRRREAAALARVVDHLTRAVVSPETNRLATPHNYLLMIGVGW